MTFNSNFTGSQHISIATVMKCMEIDDEHYLGDVVMGVAVRTTFACACKLSIQPGTYI
jgi:hypothetical protein